LKNQQDLNEITFELAEKSSKGKEKDFIKNLMMKKNQDSESKNEKKVQKVQREVLMIFISLGSFLFFFFSFSFLYFLFDFQMHKRVKIKIY